MGDQAYCLSRSYNYMYDLSDNAWTSKTGMIYTKPEWSTAWGSGGSNTDGFVFGSDDGLSDRKCEKFSIAGNSWIAKTDQPTNSGGGGSRPYLLGYIWSPYLRYRDADDTWSAAGHLTERAAFQVGGFLYSIGYGAGLKVEASSLVASYISAYAPVNRNASAGWADGTYGYFSGGNIVPPNDYPSSDCCRYDPAANSWSTRVSMGASTTSAGAFVIEGKGHSVAGKWTSGTSTYNGRYDNGGNSWTSKASYPNSNGGSGFYIPDNLPPNTPTGLSASNT